MYLSTQFPNSFSRLNKSRKPFINYKTSLGLYDIPPIVFKECCDDSHPYLGGITRFSTTKMSF